MASGFGMNINHDGSSYIGDWKEGTFHGKRQDLKYS